MPRKRIIMSALAAAVLVTTPMTAAVAHPGQHGPDEGHLLGSGASGVLEFVGKADVTDTPDLIADVGVDPRLTHAYLANWGEPKCAENSEGGGINNPDAGIYVVDISDPATPQRVGFIPGSQDSRPGEGVQALEITTKFFNGVMLVTNNEQCGKNGKGGVSLHNVTNPLKPYKLSEHFGDRGTRADANEIHSAFAWDTGDRAYLVMTDNAEATDVDILDITNPKRPRQIADLDLNAFVPGGIDQPEIGLTASFLHDMVVKQIDGDWIMLLSYWDGGYVQLNVNNPASPVFIRDTDYNNPDPELFESAGIALPPEGNGHQNEFTLDNEFFIGTDEDFSPYRSIFSITTGSNAGEYPAGEFGWTPPIVNLPDKALNGPTVFAGYGCTLDHQDPVPPASVLDGVVAPGEDRIAVFERGPVGDPRHPHEACFFSEKVEAAANAGYDGVIIANHHTGAQLGDAPDAHFCGSQGHVAATVPAVCVGHRTMHLLFNTAPAYDADYAGSEPAFGAIGERVNAEAVFDGWGYVHLFDREAQGTAAELDTYAIPEAHDPAYAFGFGDLSVHEVATSKNHWDRAYLSYYSGGMRAVDIVCSNPADKSTCELVEVGSYLDPAGNDFWGVETFVKDGTTYVLGSDRDSGLWIFRDTRP